MHDFVFLAEAGPHLPIPEGWKAELTYALARWANSLSSTAMWRISQLLAVQSVTPHWATGAQRLSIVELTTLLAATRDANR